MEVRITNAMHYRSEIDGLRAFAVISVLLYHAEFHVFGQKWVSGGYIGVDIFFVLSGYLITRILFKELLDTDHISIIKFYERRARRILPMLLTVIVVSLPFAWIILLPTDLVEYAQSVFASLLFVSNFFFFFATTEYGAESSLLKPFLHTWSLSIEEQFYIVFPVFLALAFRLFRRYLIHSFFLLFFASLVFSFFAQRASPDLNFYLPMSRAWELLAGSILAYFEMTRGRVSDPLLNRAAPLFGLAMMVIPFFTFNAQTAHPGPITLIPVLGVALIVAFSSGKDLVGKFLSLPILRGVGLISYSAYLWHFPLFAFARYTNSTPSNLDKLLWIGITLLLSIASFWLIEKPTRNRKLLNVPGLATLLILPLGLVLSAHGKIVSEHGFNDRLPQIFAEDFSQKPWEINRTGSGEFCYGRTEFCLFESQGKRRLFIVGDSTLESITHTLYPALNEKGFDVVSMNSAGCYFAPNFYSSNGWGNPREVIGQPCDLDFQELRVQEIRRHPGSVIILGGNINSYIYNSHPEGTGMGFTTELEVSFSENFKSEVELLLQEGFTIVQIYPQPTARFPHGLEVKKLLDRNPEASRDDIIAVQAYQYNTFKSGTRIAFDLLDSINHPNYHRVYPEQAFCDTLVAETCVFSDGDSLYLVDRNHAAQKGAELISELVLEAIDQL